MQKNKGKLNETISSLHHKMDLYGSKEGSDDTGDKIESLRNLFSAKFHRDDDESQFRRLQSFGKFIERGKKLATTLQYFVAF